jgi:hypothetical protein
MKTLHIKTKNGLQDVWYLEYYSRLIENILHAKVLDAIVEHYYVYRQDTKPQFLHHDVKILFWRLIKIRNMWAHQKTNINCQYLVQCYQTLHEIISVLGVSGDNEVKKIMDKINKRKKIYIEYSLIEIN